MENKIRSMRRLIVLGIVAIGLASCGETEDKVTETVVEQNLTKVSVVEAEKRMFEHYFEIQGAVEADKNIIVVPEIGGLITDLLVNEGQTIQKGQIIAMFDSKLVSANKNEVQEQLGLAKYMYEKQKMLFDKGIGSEVSLKQAETHYKSLQGTIATMNTQQAMYELKAPFTGYVEEVYATIGSVAGPGSPIIRLISLDKMSVKADVSEVFVKNIGPNSLAHLKFPAIDVEVKNVKVKRIGKFVNPANRTVVLEIEIPKPTDKMIPNMMSVIKIRDYYDTSAVVIPSRTILRDINQDPYVFVLKGNKVYETKIETGQSSDGHTQVLNGLSFGQMIVDKGSRGVKDEQEVVVK